MICCDSTSRLHAGAGVADSPELGTDIERWFDRVPGYLNTASVGLPPRRAVAACRERLAEWQAGRSDPPSFDPDVSRSRSAFARIAGTRPEQVGIASQVSTVSGMAAVSLEDRAVVLCAEEEFTSVTFPFLADSRLETRFVPLDRLLESVTDEIDLVAVSAVQSSDGRVIDLDRLVEVARDHDVRTFVDATQAAGWLTLDAGRFDVTACHGYKWLCSPRGAGFLTVSEEAMGWLKPVNAGWYAGEDPWASIYGPPLRLAHDARRFDVSPAWFSYSGAAEALEILADLGPESVGEYSVGLANRFRESVGLEPSNSAIVSLDSTAGNDLAAAGFSVAHRANRVRLSFYVYNSDEDADRAARIVTG